MNSGNAYWDRLATKFGKRVASIATGSAMPGCDLISARDQGEITSAVAEAAAREICGASLNVAARRESDFCRAYDI